MKRGFHGIALRFALVLTIPAMLVACASEPTKTEVAPPPPTQPTEAPQVGPVRPPAPKPDPVPPPGPITPPSPTPVPPPLPDRRITSPTTDTSVSPKPAPQEGVAYFVHTVKYPGETLSIIAAWYLGDKMRYDVLAAANLEINPKLIRVGMKIKIPENIMKKRESMNKEFVDSFYKPQPAPPPRPKEEAEPVPIGPK